MESGAKKGGSANVLGRLVQHSPGKDIPMMLHTLSQAWGHVHDCAINHELTQSACDFPRVRIQLQLSCTCLNQRRSSEFSVKSYTKRTHLKNITVIHLDADLYITLIILKKVTKSLSFQCKVPECFFEATKKLLPGVKINNQNRTIQLF